MTLKRSYCAVVLAMVAVPLSGCVWGPVALEASRIRYNEVLRATTSEQLLLNLVRLQYREAPLFLEVGSVSAQFSFEGSADATGIINEGPNPVNPDRLDLSAGVGYAERPTVTFSPLQGSDFVNQLLSPLRLEMIVLLSGSGWSVDRILRVTLQSMNGLENASGASGPTPDRAPRYEAFARVSRLFRELQKQGLLEIGYETSDVELSHPVPVEQMHLPEVVEAVSNGYRLRPTADGENVVLTGPSRTLVWRIPPAVADSPEVKEIVALLGLQPGLPAYAIQPAAGGRANSAVAPGQRREINVATRSLMGALFYLSQAVRVPDEHHKKGLVTTTLTAEGDPFDWALVTGDLFQVRSQTTWPRDAAVAVRHRGYWFYIDDTDLTSKSTFGLLSQLFALQAGEVEGVAPVLTLPVGG